ncbi:MAG: ABC transporter ATP-binding protein [Candidatus Margulisbacteria bacterium]|nr:ABC transporter ATP-binding protein [Candidatus Margulisiibacteriota bacterium]MBU1728840.1 ABC transporter ATP-binding protein [Candidatus Margulisiibacteriota bacterium]MBU1955471.1 ABC transporter ATP-binding protein [Candidatus Margulisiibacteriota bacterium]
MIKIRKLKQYFDQNKVLDGIDLDVEEAKTLAIIGPSGCGKSTLLRLILELDRPTAGSIFVDGAEVTKLSEDQLFPIRQKMGMIFQSSALFDSMTVGENVGFALKQHTKLSDAEIKKKVDEKLELVDLSGTDDLMPSELSGGMQKRIGLARALALDPKIILYDEPTTGLDPITSLSIETLINRLAGHLKVTSILVTHQLSTIFRTASRVVMLHEGKLIEGGTVADVRNTSNKILKEFIAAGLIE